MCRAGEEQRYFIIKVFWVGGGKKSPIAAMTTGLRHGVCCGCVFVQIFFVSCLVDFFVFLLSHSWDFFVSCLVGRGVCLLALHCNVFVVLFRRAARFCFFLRRLRAEFLAVAAETPVEYYRNTDP